MSSNKNGTNRGYKIISSKEAWKKVGEKDYRLRTESYDFYGKVDSSCGGFIIKAVNDGFNTAFVEDFTNISNATKNNIARYFCNSENKKFNRKVVYLVKDKKNKKGGGKN